MEKGELLVPLLPIATGSSSFLSVMIENCRSTNKPRYINHICARTSASKNQSYCDSPYYGDSSNSKHIYNSGRTELNGDLRLCKGWKVKRPSRFA
jgi:hypothetical protein